MSTLNSLALFYLGGFVAIALSTLSNGKKATYHYWIAMVAWPILSLVVAIRRYNK